VVAFLSSPFGDLRWLDPPAGAECVAKGIAIPYFKSLAVCRGAFLGHLEDSVRIDLFVGVAACGLICVGM
jgi:hypothetical protein